MAENEKKKRTLWEQAVENALHFAFNLAFVFIFQSIFGVQNVLPGVAISVGMTMFPDGYIGVRPVTMAGIIIGLYCGCVIAGQTALMLPAAALVIDFLFVLLIMALTCEPTMYKPAISFLLCFVFAQSTPVPPAAFPMRLAGAAAGAAAVAVTTVIKWYWQGHGKEGRGLKEQIRLCTVRKGYILRMSMGIAAAMFIGMVLHLRKPCGLVLW